MDSTVEQFINKFKIKRKKAHIRQDSRLVQNRDLFLAINGEQNDGRLFIDDAIKRGAASIIYDDSADFSLPALAVPSLKVDNLQQQASEIASYFYDHPSQQIPVIGITGTNGKTTISQLFAQLLDILGKRCGVIGTLGSGFYDDLTSLNNTTPSACDTQMLLADLLKKGAQAVAMEVSSHALVQYRVAAVDFNIAVFSNLSRDHLDYHKDMKSYAAAKAKLFVGNHHQYHVINIDDAYGKLLTAKVPINAIDSKVLTYSLSNSGADIYAYNINLSHKGIKANIIACGQKGELQSQLLGEFNLSNLLAVIGCAVALGFDLSVVLDALVSVKPPQGRMQCLGEDHQPKVVVDYAHTPDALEQVLKSLRLHTSGRLICVFGCGGERDKGKRPLMAHVAGLYADHTVVTADNSRSEDVEAIFADIKSGFASRHHYEFIADRAKAIEHAINMASAQDLVLIAGKGHETYQEVNGVRHDFADVLHAQKYLDTWSRD